MTLEFIRSEWLRCLSQCFKLFFESLDILAPIQSIEHKKEFSQTDEGYNFLLGR